MWLTGRKNMECSANTHLALLCARRGGSKELKALSAWWEGRRRWWREDSCKQIVCVHTLEVRWVSHTLPRLLQPRTSALGTEVLAAEGSCAWPLGGGLSRLLGPPAVTAWLVEGGGSEETNDPMCPGWLQPSSLQRWPLLIGPVGRWLWGFNPNPVTSWQCDPRMHGASLGIPGFPHLKTRVVAAPRCNGLKVFIPLKLTG